MAQKVIGEIVRLVRNQVSTVFETVEDEPGGDIEVRPLRQALIKKGSQGLAVGWAKEASFVDVLFPSGQIWPISRRQLEVVQ